jgi:hypothetical protein
MLHLSPATFKDMEGMVKVIYAVSRELHDPFVDLCLPGLGKEPSGVSVEQGIEDTTKRYIEEWKKMPRTQWVMVIDDESEDIVAYNHTTFPGHISQVLTVMTAHLDGWFTHRTRIPKPYQNLKRTGFVRDHRCETI